MQQALSTQRVRRAAAAGFTAAAPTPRRACLPRTGAIDSRGGSVRLPRCPVEDMTRDVGASRNRRAAVALRHLSPAAASSDAERRRRRLSGDSCSRRSASGRPGACQVRCDAVRSTVPIPSTPDEAMILLERLQRNTLETGTATGMNLVAFGGGVAATLAAYLVHSAFEERCAAVFVRVPGATDAEFRRAQYLASFLGIELWELPAVPSPAPQHTANDATTAGGAAAAAADHATGAASAASGVFGSQDAPLTSLDGSSLGALGGALAAIRALLHDQGGPSTVVFDGLHAEDIAADEDIASGWDGSEDSGEQLSACYASVAEAADRDVELDYSSAADVGQRVRRLAGLPAARRVSLLAGLPEIALRAVADLAGMPNWDWMAGAQPVPQANGNGSGRMLPVAGPLPALDLAQTEAEAVVSQILAADGLAIRVGESEAAVVEVDAEAAEAVVAVADASALPAVRALEGQLQERLAALGLCLKIRT